LPATAATTADTQRPPIPCKARVTGVARPAALPSRPVNCEYKRVEGIGDKRVNTRDESYADAERYCLALLGDPGSTRTGQPFPWSSTVLAHSNVTIAPRGTSGVERCAVNANAYSS
jgi:hypothetical protein